MIVELNVCSILANLFLDQKMLPFSCDSNNFNGWNNLPYSMYQPHLLLGPVKYVRDDIMSLFL